MTERSRRPAKPIDEEDPHEPEDGPRRPKINRPDVGRVLRRMNQVPRDKARRYANPQNIGQ
ncbi:MAG: ubiquitin-like protein UBact [bacterium]|nr:ubiquitin-like protein UBact [bacterium]